MRWAGTQVYEEAPKNAPCVFCGAPAPYRCFWPCRCWVDVKPVELDIGDPVMCSGLSSTVKHVEACTFHVKRLNRIHSFSRFAKKPVMTIRMVPCGAPICESHVQERAENRHICMEHWKAWEKVA